MSLHLLSCLRNLIVHTVKCCNFWEVRWQSFLEPSGPITTSDRTRSSTSSPNRNHLCCWFTTRFVTGPHDNTTKDTYPPSLWDIYYLKCSPLTDPTLWVRSIIKNWYWLIMCAINLANKLIHHFHLNIVCSQKWEKTIRKRIHDEIFSKYNCYDEI